MAATGLASVANAQPTVAPNERGDLALVPYYTVLNEWVTGLHIVNTSARTQVVKVRFRRATDAMDALDFNLVLSPHDVYAGFLSRDPDGAIAWTSPDTTCTVPATQGNRLHMPDLYRADAESGYVEIIAMGAPEDEMQPIALAAAYRDKLSHRRDCDLDRDLSGERAAGLRGGALEFLRGRRRHGDRELDRHDHAHDEVRC